MADMSEDEAADKAKDRLIEINSRLYDRAAAYTNLILIGGYAGAFTIWHSTRAQMPVRASVLIAALLGASLTVFIFFEVYKMTVNALHFRRISQMLATASSSIDFLSKYRAAERETHRASFTGYIIWAVCLAFCVVTAILALLLLFYNFFAFLVGLALWPT